MTDTTQTEQSQEPHHDEVLESQSEMQKNLYSEQFHDFFDALECLYIKSNMSGRLLFTKNWPFFAQTILGDELIQIDQSGVNTDQQRERRAELEQSATEIQFDLIETLEDMQDRLVEYGSVNLEVMEEIMKKYNRETCLYIFSERFVNKYHPPVTPQHVPTEPAQNNAEETMDSIQSIDTQSVPPTGNSDSSQANLEGQLQQPQPQTAAQPTQPNIPQPKMQQIQQPEHATGHVDLPPPAKIGHTVETDPITKHQKADSADIEEFLELRRNIYKEKPESATATSGKIGHADHSLSQNIPKDAGSDYDHAEQGHPQHPQENEDSVQPRQPASPMHYNIAQEPSESDIDALDSAQIASTEFPAAHAQASYQPEQTPADQNAQPHSAHDPLDDILPIDVSRPQDTTIQTENTLETNTVQEPNIQSAPIAQPQEHEIDTTLPEAPSSTFQADHLQTPSHAAQQENLQDHSVEDQSAMPQATTQAAIEPEITIPTETETVIETEVMITAEEAPETNTEAVAVTETNTTPATKNQHQSHEHSSVLEEQTFAQNEPNALSSTAQQSTMHSAQQATIPTEAVQPITSPASSAPDTVQKPKTHAMPEHSDQTQTLAPTAQEEENLTNAQPAQPHPASTTTQFAAPQNALEKSEQAIQTEDNNIALSNHEPAAPIETLPQATQQQESSQNAKTEAQIVPPVVSPSSQTVSQNQTAGEDTQTNQEEPKIFKPAQHNKTTDNQSS